MSLNKEGRQSRVKAIKKNIAAKLATGGACFVLSASAAVGQVQDGNSQPSASQDFMQRVEKLQNSPKNPFKLQISESQSGTTKVAWSNWDNWNKSGGQGGNWNNWGNY
jgi:hypothetical protein